MSITKITNTHPYKFFILRGTKDLIDNVSGIKSYYNGARDKVVGNSITDGMDSDIARGIGYTRRSNLDEWGYRYVNVYTRWCHMLKVVQL